VATRVIKTRDKSRDKRVTSLKIGKPCHEFFRRKSLWLQEKEKLVTKVVTSVCRTIFVMQVLVVAREGKTRDKLGTTFAKNRVTSFCKSLLINTFVFRKNRRHSPSPPP